MAATLKDFEGNYLLDRQNSGDLGAAHLSLSGVNFIKRKMLTSLAIEYEYRVEGDVLTEKTITTFVTKLLSFNVGGEPTTYFDDAFGADFIRTTRFENGKIVSEIKEKNGKFVINESRYLSDDKKTVHQNAVMTYGSKTAESKRQFIRK